MLLSTYSTIVYRSVDGSSLWLIIRSLSKCLGKLPQNEGMMDKGK